MIKARNGTKVRNKYYIFNPYTLALEPLENEEEMILLQNNIFSRQKLQINIAFYEDLKEMFFNENNNKNEKDKNEDKDVNNLFNLFEKEEKRINHQQISQISNKNNEEDIDKIIDEIF